MNDLVVVLFYRYTQVDDPAAQIATLDPAGSRHNHTKARDDRDEETAHPPQGNVSSVAAYEALISG